MGSEVISAGPICNEPNLVHAVRHSGARTPQHIMKRILRIEFLRTITASGLLSSMPVSKLFSQSDCQTDALSPEAQAMRKRFRYTEPAQDRVKSCLYCARFSDTGVVEPCRYTCRLLPGPVAPEGGCDQWMPLVG